jgi:hypothetical protein
VREFFLESCNPPSSGACEALTRHLQAKRFK